MVTPSVSKILIEKQEHHQFTDKLEVLSAESPSGALIIFIHCMYMQNQYSALYLGINPHPPKICSSENILRTCMRRIFGKKLKKEGVTCTFFCVNTSLLGYF